MEIRRTICSLPKMGTHDTARGNLGSIKMDYRALRAVVKCTGTQVVFSSILPVRGKV